jgi:hypothetical protein
MSHAYVVAVAQSRDEARQPGAKECTECKWWDADLPACMGLRGACTRGFDEDPSCQFSPGPSEARKRTWMREMAAFELLARQATARGESSCAYWRPAASRRQALQRGFGLVGVVQSRGEVRDAREPLPEGCRRSPLAGLNGARRRQRPRARRRWRQAVARRAPPAASHRVSHRRRLLPTFPTQRKWSVQKGILLRGSLLADNVLNSLRR